MGKDSHCLLWMIYHADCCIGPVYISKMDLSNRFYQFHLTPTGALSLATPFPNLPHEPKLVSMPTRLPMGWMQSPPTFSTGTKTIANLINEALETNHKIPAPHHLEAHSFWSMALLPSTLDPYPMLKTGPLQLSLAYVNVFVDNFCKLAQGWDNCLQVKRQTYHSIDWVFCCNNNQDQNQKEPISTKKLLKGDAHLPYLVKS